MKNNPIVCVILLVSLLAGTVISLRAQSYQTALGLRIDGSAGITAKHFVRPAWAVEGILHIQQRGLGLTGLGVRHIEPFPLAGLSVFAGGGVHAGYWNRLKENPLFTGESRVILGLDAIAGAEYCPEKVPVSFGIDWKPMLNLTGVEQDDRWVVNGALSVRYTFK
ncbi:MAG: hypothetical protein SF053_03835 [Bacteroidia bacterium]|nr:hypothetical protein [Bacteroidia bacterium]